MGEKLKNKTCNYRVKATPVTVSLKCRRGSLLLRRATCHQDAASLTVQTFKTHIRDVLGYKNTEQPIAFCSSPSVKCKGGQTNKQISFKMFENTIPGLSGSVNWFTDVHAAITASSRAEESPEAAVERSLHVSTSDCANQAVIMNGQPCRLTRVQRILSDKVKWNCWLLQ